MANRLTEQETVQRMWGNLDGLVWALRLRDVPLEVIIERVRQADAEVGPSDQPAFVVKDTND